MKSNKPSDMKNRYTRDELVEVVAIKAGLTFEQGQAFFESFKEVVADVVSSGEKVLYKDFLCFRPHYKPPRVRTCPSTGEDYSLGETCSVKIVASDNFIKQVDEMYHEKNGFE